MLCPFLQAITVSLQTSFLYIYICLCSITDIGHCLSMNIANYMINIYMCVCVYIYIYIYIYCHPQTGCFLVSQLLSVTRHIGCLKLGSKPNQLYIRLSIILLSQQENRVSSGIIRHYVVAFVCLHSCLTGYQSAQFIRRALHYMSGSCKFLHQSTQPQWNICVCVYVRVCVRCVQKVSKFNLYIPRIR